MSHTPGPWKVDPHESGGPGDHLLVDETGRIVAHFQFREDAELAAAAPDLMQELELIVNKLDHLKRLRSLRDLIEFSNHLSKFRGQEVRLLHLYNVMLPKWGRSAKFTTIENKNIQKLQWVSEGVPARILMPDGKWIEGVAEPHVKKLKKGKVIQFERVGFCRFDRKENDVYEFWFAHM